LAQVVARFGLVFNNQDFHRSAPHRTTAEFAPWTGASD
jgi:hypothetical protein